MSFLSKLFGSPAPSQPEAETAKAESQQERKFHTLRDDGVRAMKMHEAAYAAKCFEAALQIHPEDLPTLSYQAEALFLLREFEKAEEVLQRLVEAEPDNLNLILLLARSQGEQENFSGMRSTLRMIPECQTQHPVVLYYAAEADYKNGDPLVAVAELTQALAARPDYQAALLLRARVLSSMGSFQEALADTELLLSQDEADDDAYLLHATALAHTGKWQEAIRTLEQLHEANPFCREGILLLGNCLAHESLWDKALGLYDDAIELQPDFAEAYKQRGAVKYHLHDEAGAAEDLKRSLEIQPELTTEISGEYSNLENRINEVYRNLNPYGF